MRKIILLALALLAARMARRALARGAGDYTAIMAALWSLIHMTAMAGTANTAKTRATEARLNAVVARTPTPQAAPGTTAAGGQASGGNSSFSMGGGTNITYNSGSGNQGGGPGSNTSGQIGGAAAHYHDMTHYHTDSTALDSIFNALQGSYSGTISHLNSLMTDHNNLVADVTSLKSALKASGILT